MKLVFFIVVRGFIYGIHQLYPKKKNPKRFFTGSHINVLYL